MNYIVITKEERRKLRNKKTKIVTKDDIHIQAIYVFVYYLVHVQLRQFYLLTFQF